MHGGGKEYVKYVIHGLNEVIREKLVFFLNFLINCWSSVVASVVLCNLHCFFFENRQENIRYYGDRSSMRVKRSNISTVNNLSECGIFIIIVSLALSCRGGDIPSPAERGASPGSRAHRRA